MPAAIFGINKETPGPTKNNVQFYWRAVPAATPNAQPFMQMDGVEYPLILGGPNTNGVTIESGTWTPTVTGLSTAGSTSYSDQIGYYTRVGPLVFVQCDVNFGVSHTGDGQILVNGLPYAIVGAATPGQLYVQGYTFQSASAIGLTGQFADGEQRLRIYETINTPPVSNGSSQVDNFSGGCRIVFSGVYRTTP